VPDDRGIVEGHDVSSDAAACVGSQQPCGKIAVNPPCQNIAVVSARVAIRHWQALVVSVSRGYKSTFGGCHVDRVRVM